MAIPKVDFLNGSGENKYFDRKRHESLVGKNENGDRKQLVGLGDFGY